MEMRYSSEVKIEKQKKLLIIFPLLLIAATATLLSYLLQQIDNYNIDKTNRENENTD